MNQKIVICGAGIAGISTAYFLSQHCDNCEITLIDKYQPLSFTSAKSGENFRDYWPHACMESLASNSIDLMKQLQDQFGKDAFKMEFTGYHFISHNSNSLIFKDDNSEEFQNKNEVIIDKNIIRSKYGYLDEGIEKSVFIKNAGNVDSISMGNLMLKEAKKKGATFKQAQIQNLKPNPYGFEIVLEDRSIIHCDKVVLATGPFLNQTSELFDIKLPIWNTLQRKFILPDPHHIIPDEMPFTIYADSQILDWEIDEKAYLKSNQDLKWMTEMMPGAIHIKPEGGGRIKMGWAFSRKPEWPQWEIQNDKYFPEIVMRGASKFIPDLKKYIDRLPSPIIQYGGYYTRTNENWPLIGPLEIENTYVVGALAGFGSMTACAAGLLCAQHITNQKLPWYATYFHPNRYENPDLKKTLANISIDGQL